MNTQKSGVHQGIPFEYTGTMRRPKSRLPRLFVYFGSVFGLTVRLFRLSSRRDTLVYLYLMGGPLNLFVAGLCKLLRIPLVQELCEWFPGEKVDEQNGEMKVVTCSAFTKWLYKKPMFQLASGALVISEAIEQRVRERCAKVNPNLLIHRLPNIVDIQRFAAAPSTDELAPTFVYCGNSGWMNDVFFVLRVFTLVKQNGYGGKLTIVGCSNRRDEILKYAIERGLSPMDVVLAPYLDDRALEATYKSAIALLAPLRDDDRSRTRLPNKLAEYLASGRPVVSCNIGDLSNFLADNVNAYLGTPGDEVDFAARMIAILEDPVRAERIGLAGQQACFAHLDYRAHAGALAEFFIRCLECHPNNEVWSAQRRTSHAGISSK